MVSASKAIDPADSVGQEEQHVDSRVKRKKVREAVVHVPIPRIFGLGSYLHSPIVLIERKGQRHAPIHPRGWDQLRGFSGGSSKGTGSPAWLCA